MSCHGLTTVTLKTGLKKNKTEQNPKNQNQPTKKTKQKRVSLMAVD